MHKYENFWRRYGAAWIDGLVLMPVSMIFHMSFFGLYGSVLGATAAMLYTAFMHAKYGQTLGKMATSIKLLNIDEQRTITIGKALLRDTPLVILSVINLVIGLFWIDRSASSNTFHLIMIFFFNFGWFVLEMLSMLTNPKRRAVHDLIADSVVVKTSYLPSVLSENKGLF